MEAVDTYMGFRYDLLEPTEPSRTVGENFEDGAKGGCHLVPGADILSPSPNLRAVVRRTHSSVP